MITKNELEEILQKHEKWLVGTHGGVRADLSEANLRGADLRGAFLRGAFLREAFLRGADLRGTVLDPERAPNADCASFADDPGRPGYVIGWRTRRSTHVGDTEYAPGGIYRAPVFSVAETECHPGIYLWPTREDAQAWLTNRVSDDVVEVRARRADIHHAGTKWRAREIEVVIPSPEAA